MNTPWSLQVREAKNNTRPVQPSNAGKVFTRRAFGAGTGEIELTIYLHCI